MDDPNPIEKDLKAGEDNALADDTAGMPDAETAYENTADEASARQAIDFYQHGQLQV
jgi:hypothetical protein